MDLISLVLTLRPLAQASPDQLLPLWWGRAAHALLLNTIRGQDENLAADLHEDDGLRPFTTSSLKGSFRGGKMDLASRYSLRFTGLNPAVSQMLFNAIQPGGSLFPGNTVELDYIRFGVEKAACDATQNEWAHAGMYSSLAAEQLVNPDSIARQVSMVFHSPTQFHSQERTMPLPLPELVFGSLTDRWNAFAPITFPPELKRYAAECLVINRFDLASRPVAVKNGGKRIGAVGSVGYTTLNYDRYWMSLVQTLATFSLFAGVGAGVTMGLGQTRRMG